MRCHRTPRPRGTLAWRTVGGSGTCEGLDISLHEVVVLGLIKIEEVGFVSRVHLLSGEVRNVTTALKVVEEVQEEVQEIEDE